MSECRNGVIYLLAGLCVSLLVGCSVPGQTIRYAPADANIIGVRSALAAKKSADVVLVHGMCYHDAEWVQDANKGLADALGLTVIDSAAPPNSIGAYGGMLYARQLTGPNGELVRTFAILWSPVSAHARSELCYDANQKTDSCPDASTLLKDRRAYVNAALKNEIMDGCLSDAVYAVGAEGIAHIGSTIEEGLTQALAGGRNISPEQKLTLTPLQDQLAPLFVVTESLGSKLFIDAAIRMASRSCPAFQSMADTMKRTAQIFMEANQIPILTLAYNPSLENKCRELTDAAKPALATAGFRALVELRGAGTVQFKEELASPLKVAAFSDPNDILSYTLVPSPDLPQGLEVTDIVLVNDWAWLGFFENPHNAHTTYWGKCRVQRVIADGTAGLTEDCSWLH